MKLSELDAKFVGDYDERSFRFLDGVEGAQGVMFQCPLCAEGKPRAPDGGVMGAHYVVCWFTNPRNAPKVPDDANPKPGRWTFSGETIDELSFVGPNAASIQLEGGCNWHGFIRNGEATL